MDKFVATNRASHSPHIDEVEALSEKDGAVIQDILEVLEKHGATQRFGICLLHDHFPVEEGEVLLESSDVQNRVLTVTPVKRTSVIDSSKATMWRLETDAPVGLQYCLEVTLPNGKKIHVER